MKFESAKCGTRPRSHLAALTHSGRAKIDARRAGCATNSCAQLAAAAAGFIIIAPKRRRPIFPRANTRRVAFRWLRAKRVGEAANRNQSNRANYTFAPQQKRRRRVHSFAGLVSGGASAQNKRRRLTCEWTNVHFVSIARSACAAAAAAGRIHQANRVPFVCLQRDFCSRGAGAGPDRHVQMSAEARRELHY